jgi:hypothetical protein
MISRFIIKILFYLLGGSKMMALLLAQQVILGKLDFAEVPEVLKPQVYQHLKDSGVEFLAGDYQPPTEETPTE